MNFWAVCLVHHLPSSRFFTWKVLCSLVPCTIQRGLLLCNLILLLQQHLLCSNREGESGTLLSISPDFMTSEVAEAWPYCLTKEANLLCRSTPSTQSAPSQSVAASEASRTPASSPHALSLWQILCWYTHIWHPMRHNRHLWLQKGDQISLKSKLQYKELSKHNFKFMIW